MDVFLFRDAASTTKAGNYCIAVYDLGCGVKVGYSSLTGDRIRSMYRVSSCLGMPYLSQREEVIAWHYRMLVEQGSGALIAFAAQDFK